MLKTQILKDISWKVNYENLNVYYPPIFFWGKNIPKSLIFSSWEETVALVKKNSHHKVGVYIHIPFCETKCHFCTCTTDVVTSEKKHDEYIELLLKEMKSYSKTFSSIKIDNIYFGGGTPSLLTVKQIDTLFSGLKDNFNINHTRQIMFECSPYSINQDKLTLLKSHGVTKITFGVQSLDDYTLKENNRPQNYEQVKKAIETAKKVGIEIINMDLVAGIPGQSFESFKETVRMCEELTPTSIQVNSFKPTKHTNYCKAGYIYGKKDIDLRKKMVDFAAYLRDKEAKLPSTHRTVQIYSFAEDNGSILGLGYSSISHAFSTLGYTHTTMQDYKNFVENDETLVTGTHLSKEDEMIIFLNHNLRIGISYTKFKKIFQEPILGQPVYKKLQFYIDAGILVEKIQQQDTILIMKEESDILAAVIGKSLYNQIYIKKFEQYVLEHPQEFLNSELKVQQFFDN